MHIERARFSAISISMAACVAMAFPGAQAAAQNPELMQKLQDIKAASAANKAALAKLTWQEQDMISLKGEVKKTTVYQVTIGPDGTQQKTELSSTPAAAPPSGGRLKQHVVAKKKEEYQEYGEQVAALAKQYAKLDPQALEQAHQQGNISLQLGGGAGTTSLVVKNYLKPGDQMTIVFNPQAKAVEAINVSTYLDDPKDAVTEAIQFAKLPSGVSHVASIQINGVSKQLTVAIQNSNYQPAQM